MGRARADGGRIALSFLTNTWRRRWGSLVLLALLVALTGGLAMAGVAGARRSASARPASRRSTVITLVALVVGVPLGIAAARFVWDAIAGSMGLATDIDVPIATLVIGAVVTVVVLNLISAISARFAGRLGVAEALRVE